MMTIDELERLRRKAGSKVANIKHDQNNDLALVVAYKNGDQEAGLRLMESYLDVVSIVYRFPSRPPFKTKNMKKLFYSPLDYEDKRDLFQEILYHFFLLVEEYDPELGKFEHMIRRKLHQRVFNKFFSEFLETEINETEFSDELDPEGEFYSIILGEETPEKLPEEYIELYQAFNQLGNRQREVLEMSAVKGWSSVEIADELGITSGTVRATLRDALNNARKYLKVNEGETI